MARVFGCAVDWTYDQYAEDMRSYEAARTMQEATEAPCDEDYRGYFAVWMKTKAAVFTEEWLRTYKGLYDRGGGYVGDAFARKVIRSDFFSDFYKDAYNQRPHLDAWFYVAALGLPQSGDTARTFCAAPVEDACAMARQAREAWA